MASNKDLIKSIVEASSALGKDSPETEGLSNSELASLLKDLRAEPSEDLRSDPPEQEEKVATKPPFSVAEGKCITTMRGLLSDGDEITADDLPGGKEALDGFVVSGHVSRG